VSSDERDLEERLQRALAERNLYYKELADANRRFEEKVRELSVLRKIVASLKYTREIRRVFEVIIDSIIEETSAENCSIMLLNRQTGELSVKIAKSQTDSSSNYYFDGTGSRRTFRLGEGIAGWVAQHGESLSIPDISAGTVVRLYTELDEHGESASIPRFSENPQFVPTASSARSIGSLLCLPLIIDNEVVGVVNMSHPRPHAFGAEDARIMSIVTDQMAVAMNSVQAFDDLQRFNDALEEQVRQRTNDLQRANEELLRANEEILRTNRMKSQFFANMSHELRTPLTAIIGFSELLQDRTFGALNESQARYVDNISRSSRHLLNLINDILDLAKVESGKMKITLEPFSLRDCLDQVCNVIRPLCMEKNLTLDVEVGEEVGLVVGDEVRVKQIMYNLLSNAIKFTDEGGRVKVTAKKILNDEGRRMNAPPLPESPKDEVHRSSFIVHPSGGWVVVRVEDTGIGIRKEYHEIIFSEFQQVDGSYSRKHEGTGLGLSLTRKLVELHGGRIWVESEGEGKGSVFTFTLPQRQDVEQVA
jgi:signal transduction histidine kinase